VKETKGRWVKIEMRDDGKAGVKKAEKQCVCVCMWRDTEVEARA
jgi:hypothetical protein